MLEKKMSLLDDNGGRLYAGYYDAYKGYEPELLLIEESYRAMDEEVPARIVARTAIETQIRAAPRITTTYDGITISTPEPYVIPIDFGAHDIPEIPDVPFSPMEAVMSVQDIWNLLDVILPEELVGADITPGRRVGAETKGRVFYQNVWIENGKVKTIRKGEPRTLGYTPRFAKKKFRTRRRRKRLTKRDMYILEVLKENPQAGALALML